jgi:uncharacterized membrane protein
MGWLIGALILACCVGVPLVLLWRKRHAASRSRRDGPQP